MRLKLSICTLLFLFGFDTSYARYLQQKDINRSGIYATENGSITVAINKGVLTGVYQYYDKWDNNYKEYKDISTFYISGTSSNGINFDINTGWPGENNLIKGTLTFLGNYNKLTIVLADQPPGYAALDFTEKGIQNTFPLKREINFSWVRIVKTAKAALYAHSDSTFTPRKAYLIKGDVVCEINHQSEYIRIFYTFPGSDKSTIYWINEKDLYPLSTQQ